MEQKQEYITNSKQVVEGQIRDFIIRIVQGYFSVPEDYYCRRTRRTEIVFPRQVAAYLIRKYTKISLNQIGEKFGGKDHATILHAIRKVKDLMEVDKQIRAKVNDVDKIVQFKSKAVSEKMNLKHDYYYIDLTNFTSIRLVGEKSILLTGFSEEEKASFTETLKAIIEQREHINTGMYILEKRETNGEQGEQEK